VQTDFGGQSELRADSGSNREKIPSDGAKPSRCTTAACWAISSVPDGYDPRIAKASRSTYVIVQSRGRVATGLLYPERKNRPRKMHELNQTPETGPNSGGRSEPLSGAPTELAECKKIPFSSRFCRKRGHRGGTPRDRRRGRRERRANRPPGSVKKCGAVFDEHHREKPVPSSGQARERTEPATRGKTSIERRSGRFTSPLGVGRNSRPRRPH